MSNWLQRLGTAASGWTTDAPWTNVYGVARTLLALATAGTLAFSSTSTLFRPTPIAPLAPECTGVAQYSLFCQFPAELDAVRWLAVGLLLVVASGWRPRITGPLHWYVCASLSTSAALLDGGDHVAAVLTFILLPVTLTDGRRWHWTAPDSGPAPDLSTAAQRLIGWSGLVVAQVQVAFIYAHAGIAKMGVGEWLDGTALYYWLTDGPFSAPTWMDPLLLPMLHHPVSVTLMTWSVMIFEVGLALALFMGRGYRRRMLVLGILFHAGIALVHGLASFATIMSAALILLLRSPTNPFAVPSWAAVRSEGASWMPDRDGLLGRGARLGSRWNAEQSSGGSPTPSVRSHLHDGTSAD